MRITIKQLFCFGIISFNVSVFILYGTVKLSHMQLSEEFLIHSNIPCNDARPIDIMWYFFSLKRGYVLVIAISQIISAILLILKRTRLFGVLLYLFIVSNILAIGLFYGIFYGPLIISGMCFFNCLILLYFEKSKLKILFSKEIKEQ